MTPALHRLPPVVLIALLPLGCPAAGDDDVADDDSAAGDDDTTDATDLDGDGWSVADGDCDDGDPGAHPGAAEACDGVDNDCDGQVDGFVPEECPEPLLLVEEEGAGLIASPAGVFGLADEGGWAAATTLLDDLSGSLAVVPVGQLLEDANRTGVRATAADLTRVEDLHDGFRWNDGDVAVTYWYPQGVTGSWDASPDGLVDGRRVAAVAWHYDEEDAGTAHDKGVRVSFADITDMDDISYRHVLLVDPFDNGGRADFRAAEIHAGGIVWLGDHLLVADTTAGIRVFDMTRLLEVATGVDAIGWDGESSYHAYNYRYVLPQVSRYVLAPCSCEARFSFLSLDRSSSPPSLVSGNYVSAAITGMLYRWPLEGDLPAGGEGTTGASEAWLAQHDRMQGAQAHDGAWWLSCSSQNGPYGRLYRTADETPSSHWEWVDGPEDLSLDLTTDELWSASEDPGDRWVFSVLLADVGG